MQYHPLTESDKTAMLKDIGAESLEELLRDVPKSLRRTELNIPEPLSEAELQSLFKEIGQKNRTLGNTLSFLGGGSYEHFIPSAVSSITGRHEFYTAYTPYQAEASQGSLQAIYEFQSLIVELLGLDVSNASHYNGASSLAEAALLALRHTGRHKILVARTVHPEYRQVLHTYLEGTPYEVEEVSFGPGGELDHGMLQSSLNDEVAGVIVQTPNFLGTIENLEGVAEKVHAVGGLLIISANPISLGVLRSPGEWGADIAVGEGQPLGIPMQYGGPYLGIFATTRALMRKMPGRLAGLTVDSEGKRAYCLTLQAREQHIRRERAASNICTNQALCALAACVFMTLLGRKGIQEIGEINMDRAAYLRSEIAKISGFEVVESQIIFNEFLVKTKKDVNRIKEKLLAENVFPGISLESYYPELKENHLLVCATEVKTKIDLDRFVELLRKC